MRQIHGCLVLRGLNKHVERLADELARRVAFPSRKTRRVFGRVCELLASTENSMAGAGLRVEHLTARTREHVAWLRFMSSANRFAEYMAAVRRAPMIFESVAARGVWLRPIVTHFRPLHSLFRMRPIDDGTFVLLPTPFMGVDDASFEVLGRAMFRRRDRRRNARLHAILLSQPYQELQAELDSLGGAVEQTRGLVHDLSESFHRVNAAYFKGQMPRPRLTWSQSFTVHKFGHYNYSSDTVMVSRTLDHPAVPVYVIDHVMHHELLHKKHGVRWRNGRGHAHTQEFRVEERQFVRYAEADALLRRLATRTHAR